MIPSSPVFSNGINSLEDVAGGVNVASDFTGEARDRPGRDPRAHRSPSGVAQRSAWEEPWTGCRWKA